MIENKDVNDLRKRILLVDDEENLLEVLTRRIQSWGYEVITATTGEECMKIAEEREPDLILLDIILPKMRGREVCSQLKVNPRTQHIPVLFLTALGMPEQIEAGFSHGADGYILKPFNANEVKDWIQNCL